MKLNIGCGETKLEGFINIDMEPSAMPDLIVDIRTGKLPYEDNSVEEIYCIHNIEHIEYRLQRQVLTEMWRVLEKDGKLILAYPEFEKCAENFIKNYKGMKDFFRATLYGLQRYQGDYHVTPMVTSDLIDSLLSIGFTSIQHTPEIEEPYNTFLVCHKGIHMDREVILNESVFGV